MRKLAHPSRRTRRLAVAAIAGLTAALVPAANAYATILSTTTKVTATPATSTVGTSVTLQATVTVALNLAPPQGSVTFTSSNASGTTATLGTVSMASCSKSPCTATLVTSALPLGSTSVTATYAAQGLTAGSSGSTAVTVNPNSTPGTAQSVTCYAGQPCNTGTMVSSNNTTKLQISATPSSGTQTVSGSLTTGTLPCQPAGNEPPDNDGDDDDGVFVGALATFSSTASDSTKTITYTGVGTSLTSVGGIMWHQYSEHPTFASCYGQDTPFMGYTHGVYKLAVWDEADKLYVAQLSNCANNGGAKPCFTNVKTSTSDSYVITTQAGDPKNVG